MAWWINEVAASTLSIVTANIQEDDWMTGSIFRKGVYRWPQGEGPVLGAGGESWRKTWRHRLTRATGVEFASMCRRKCREEERDARQCLIGTASTTVKSIRSPTCRSGTGEDHSRRLCTSSRDLNQGGQRMGVKHP